MAPSLRTLGRTLRSGAVVTLVLAAAVACTDGPDRDAAGTVVAGRASTRVEGSSGFLLVPAGRIDVTVGEPVTAALPATSTADDAEHAPPTGGSFVPVAWSHHPFALPAGMALVGTDPRPTEIALLVDGTSYPLGSPYGVPSVGGTVDSPVGVMYVAVPGVPESVVVSAAYDGLTQTLDPRSGQLDPGAAGPLYHHIDHVGAPRCAADGWSGQRRLTATTRCRVSEPRRLPYLPEVGWAEPGRSWLVVGYRVTLDVARGADPADRYRSSAVSAELTLDGAGPVADRSGPGSGRPDTVAGVLAFDGALTGGRLGLRVTFTVERVDPPDGDPRPTELVLARELRLG